MGLHMCNFMSRAIQEGQRFRFLFLEEFEKSVPSIIYEFKTTFMNALDCQKSWGKQLLCRLKYFIC